MKNKSIFSRLFLLTWKKTAIVLIIGAACIFLHNVFSGLFNVEEAVFFIIAFPVIPIYFLVAVIYTIIKRAFKKSGK